MWTVRDIESVMEAWAPAATAMSYDNVGLLAGRPGAPVCRALAALDITPAVLAEAAACGAGIIVSHHPLFREPFLRLTDETPQGELLISLLESRVAALCMHTNLDAARGGVNDMLAARMGLPEPLCVLDAENGMGRWGELPQALSAAELADTAKLKLGCGGVRVLDSGKPIARLAVCGGSGSDLLGHVQRAGCDAFLVGELKHSAFLEGAVRGLTLLECGHFATEYVVVEPMARRLRENLPGLEVLLSELSREPYTWR